MPVSRLSPPVPRDKSRPTAASAAEASGAGMVSDKVGATEAEIRAWCVDYCVGTLKLPARFVEPEVKFTRMGMDSAMAVYFVMALEERLGVELPPELLFERQTIAEVASYVAGTDGRGGAAGGA
jgi:acyl carrier protein